MMYALIRPKAGVLIRDPVTHRFLGAKGETKPLDLFWRRRIRDGDVEAFDVTPEKKKPIKNDKTRKGRS